MAVAYLRCNPDCDIAYFGAGIYIGFAPSEEISWPDIDQFFVLESSYKGGATFKLIIVSKRGKKITVSVADKFPAQFGPLLQKVVAERAPQATDIQRIAEIIAYARTHSD